MKKITISYSLFSYTTSTIWKRFMESGKKSVFFEKKIHGEVLKKSSGAFLKKVPMIFQKGPELFFGR